MARPCTVCEHPDVEQINRQLVDLAGNTKRYRLIATERCLGFKSLERHEKGHLTDGLKRAVAKHAEIVTETAQLDVMASLGRMTERAEQMLTACHDWLQDPDDPTRYNLNPRTHEVSCVVEETVSEDGIPVRSGRRTERLNDLLRAAEAGTGLSIVKAEAKIADPRKLLLEAVAAMKPVVELIGKATGQIVEREAADYERRLKETVAIVLAAFDELPADLRERVRAKVLLELEAVRR